MNLFELTEQYKAIEAAAYNEELTYDEFTAALEALTDDLDSKVDGYCAIITELKADAKALKEEESRLASRRKGLEARADRLRTTLAESMAEQGREKIRTAHRTVWLAETTALEITDLSQVPAEYIKPLTEEQVMRTMIKAELELTGEVLPWARLVTKKGLRVR